MIPGDDEIVQHVIPINKSGLQDILSLDKRRQVQISTQEIMHNMLLPGSLLTPR